MGIDSLQIPPPAAILNGQSSTARVEELDDGRRRITLIPRPGFHVRRTTCVTAYPWPLIREIHQTKDLFLCDEIMREEDPRYVERALRHQVLGYLPPAAFAGARILDFGCGSGASTMVLGRLLPPCEIVGIELDEKLLGVARLRAKHFGRNNVQFLRSPTGDSLPSNLGVFDYAIFSAVFEHLLPHERPQLLGKVWNLVKKGGVLFLNQTPYRYSPVEVHTTGGLPLINYLPDRLALFAARHFSAHVQANENWETLLRRGIRGGTIAEILDILKASSTPVLLEPAPEVGDRIDLWFATLSPRYGALKKLLWLAMKTLKAAAGIELTPTLMLAIRKES